MLPFCCLHFTSCAVLLIFFLHHPLDFIPLDFLKRDMDVLELACGTGQLSVPLSPCVRSWEATDFSAEMIRQAKKQVHSSRLHFSVQDTTVRFAQHDDLKVKKE